MMKTMFVVFLFSYYILKLYAASCNVTSFEDWKNQKYTGVLATDSSFWRYQQQKFFVLTNELAIQLAVADCTKLFELLFYYKSGKMGPVDIQTSYKQMCSSVCLESDYLHEQAMSYTSCSCSELSTQQSSSSYSIENDFCLENTARILCDETGFCGIWNCRESDFMCPRYEWNKKVIPYKGPGDCSRNASVNSNQVSWLLIGILLTILTIFV